MENNHAFRNCAIKQISPDLNLTDADIIDKYERSESVAFEFSNHGIPSVAALKKGSKHLVVIEDKGYLIYPWVNGYTLAQNEVSQYHAIKIAEMIAKIHTAQLNINDLPAQRFDMHSTETLKEAINQSLDRNFPFAATLKKYQTMLINVNQQYQAIVPLLQQEEVVTHGDLDQLNAIWSSDDQPSLIDWESARLMNPTRDIVRTSLSWGGMGIELFEAMIQTYIKYGGRYNIKHECASLKSVYGSLINWILYNIRSAVSHDETNSIDAENNEILGAISRLTTLNTLIPCLLGIIQ